MDFPVRYRLLCGPRPRNPQRVAGENDNPQKARPRPIFARPPARRRDFAQYSAADAPSTT